MLILPWPLSSSLCTNPPLPAWPAAVVLAGELGTALGLRPLVLGDLLGGGCIEGCGCLCHPGPLWLPSPWAQPVPGVGYLFWGSTSSLLWEIWGGGRMSKRQDGLGKAPVQHQCLQGQMEPPKDLRGGVHRPLGPGRQHQIVSPGQSCLSAGYRQGRQRIPSSPIQPIAWGRVLLGGGGVLHHCQRRGFSGAGSRELGEDGCYAIPVCAPGHANQPKSLPEYS